MRRSQGFSVLIGVLALVAGLLAAAPSTADDVAPPAASAADRRTADERLVDRAPVPRLSWGRCRGVQFDGTPFRTKVRCASIRVPLDYDDPAGPTTRLRVSKLPASQPGRRVGSLFVNPGGPGGASAPFVGIVAEELGKRAHQRFDIVGVDPRGTGGSGGVKCRSSVAPLTAGFPLGQQQVKAWIANDNALRRACAKRGTPLVKHASTADVARDMDLVRRALGDDQLTYYGISYGTYLGATYGALFPQRVRALVVDGVLDPIAWSTGNPTRRVTTPQTTRLRSGYGAYEALTAALTECDRVGAQRCPIAPNALGTWKRVVSAARTGRLVVEGERLSYQDLIGLALGALYDRSQIPFLMDLVAQLDAALDVAATRDARRVVVRRSAALRSVTKARDDLRERGLYTSPRARPSKVDVLFPTVLCSDGRNPRPASRWEKASRVADRKSPWFGRLWTWSSSLCARQGLGSGADSFRGPWRTTTSYPLLVVGNTHDPATPISGARRLNTLFDDSVLVTWDGWGHGALGGGGCITGIMTGYLVDRTLPPDGTVCKQPRELFR